MKTEDGVWYQRGWHKAMILSIPHLLEQIFRKSCIFSMEATHVQCSKGFRSQNDPFFYYLISFYIYLFNIFVLAFACQL
jgi:hypothetical protein